MNLSEDIKRYLPQYLSPKQQADLFSELESFPDNIQKRLYSNSFVEDGFIYQGDGLKRLLIVDLPSQNAREGPGLILSSTCDISFENPRKFVSPRIVYCPIIKLSTYKEWMERKGLLNESGALEAHLTAILRQEITTYFYLPRGALLDEDHIALLDRANNCDLRAFDVETIKNTRLFSLSNYGLYLFLLKLSIHFTRITEGLNRG
jgi:hypothetical protein